MSKKKTVEPKDKLGTTYTKFRTQTPRSFRVRSGLPATYGELKVTKTTTNLIVGTVKEEDLKTQVVWFNAFELAELKKLLRDFDIRLLDWKGDVAYYG